MHHRIMKRSLAALTALAAGLVMLTACGNTAATSGTTAAPASGTAAATSGGEGQLRKLTFVLDWSPNTNHTGVYAAQKLGYYAEAGLELDIVNPPEDGAEVLVASGKADIGVSFQDYMAPALALEEPLPITAIAALINHNTSGVVALKQAGISSPAGLEGKTYATWNLPVELAMMEQVVTDDGGDWSQVKLFPSMVTDVLTALKTQVDAVWIYYAWDGIAVEQADEAIDYWDFRAINPVFDLYSPVLIANDSLLAAEPELVRAFLAATAKGYQYAIDHPAEAAAILVEAAPGLSADLVAGSQAWLKDQYIADAPYWGYMDQSRWDAFYAWLWENKLIEQAIPAGKGFTNEYLPGK